MKDGLYLKATNDHVVSLEINKIITTQFEFNPNDCFFLKCLQYKTEYSQDVKKAEKLTSQLMRQMASKEA